MACAHALYVCTVWDGAVVQVYGALFAWVLLGERLHELGWVGVVLVVIANLIRRLPWRAMLAWIGGPAACRLITPHPSVGEALSGLDEPQQLPHEGAESSAGGAGGGDPKLKPLLGTPKTPDWWTAMLRKAGGGRDQQGGFVSSQRARVTWDDPRV